MSRPKRTDLFHLRYEDIHVEEGFNPRKDFGDMDELIQSIYENGVKVPLRGFSKNGKYYLTDGHRRLKACEYVTNNYFSGLLVPFIIDKTNKTPEQRILDVLICNDGKRLNPIEEAEAVNRLVNFQWTVSDIAKKIGKPVSYVSNLKLLYYAPMSVKKMIEDGKVSVSFIVQLLRNTDDYTEVINHVKEAYEEVSKKGKTRVTKNDVAKVGEEVKGIRYSSYSDLKKSLTYASNKNLKVKDEMRGLYNFVKDVIDGKLKKEDFDKLFFE